MLFYIDSLVVKRDKSTVCSLNFIKYRTFLCYVTLLGKPWGKRLGVCGYNHDI